MESLETLYGNHRGKVSQRWESYLSVYDRTFGPRRQDPLRMLEVGVQNGGSLELWARYFPHADVLVGNDIDPRCHELTFDDPRVRLVVGDITDAEVQREVASHAERFDIIIDDGSHRSADIIAGLVALFPVLEVGGVYVIEDLHCSYYASYGGGLFTQRSAMSFLRRLVDVINHDHWGLERTVAEHLQPIVDAQLPPSFLDALPTIASIEFLDSMCVIRRDGGPRPRLGNRLVAGDVAAVDSGPLAEVGRPLVGEEQLESADNVDPTSHETELRELREERARLVHQEKELRQELAEVWKRLDRTLASPSYRLMNGPRRLFQLLFRRGRQR